MRRIFIFTIIFLFMLIFLVHFSKQHVSENDSAMWTEVDVSRENFIYQVETLVPPNELGDISSISYGYDKFFRPYAEEFFEISKMHGLNPKYVFTLGIMVSNWGTSIIANSNNNIFNLGDYYDSPNDASNYNSSIESIEEACTILEEYSTPGSWEYEIISAKGYNPKTIEGQCYMYFDAPEKHVELNNLINKIFYISK